MNWLQYTLARGDGLSREAAEREAEELPSIQHMNWIGRFENHCLETLQLEFNHRRHMYELSLAIERARKEDMKHQPKLENITPSAICSLPNPVLPVSKPTTNVEDVRRKTIKRALDSYYPTLEGVLGYARTSDVNIPLGANRDVVVELILRKMIKDL